MNTTDNRIKAWSSFQTPVYVFDTDAYGVVWHGAYTKWLEKGRIDLLSKAGQTLSPPTPEELNTSDNPLYVYPVVEQHFHFKAPGKLNQLLLVQTHLTVSSPRLIFHQQVLDDTSQRLLIDVTTHCAVLTPQWKPYRRIPDDLIEAFNVLDCVWID